MPAKQAPVPRQARALPPVEAWLSNEANIEVLKSILVNPVFLAAEQYVLATSRVRSEDLAGPRAYAPEVIVRKAAIHTGMQEAFDTLRRFVISRTAVGYDEPYAHILPPTT